MTNTVSVGSVTPFIATSPCSLLVKLSSVDHRPSPAVTGIIGALGPPPSADRLVGWEPAGYHRSGESIHALHDHRAIQEPRPGPGLSPVPGSGSNGARGSDLRRELDHRRHGHLLPGHGMRRSAAGRATDGTLARTHGPRGAAGQD